MHENIHSLVESRKHGFLLKLDISKAYDRMDWRFLMKFLATLGFGNKILDLIWQLISTTNTSILINGLPSNCFRSIRGLRQGDPISHVLFTIMTESLGRYLQKLVREGNLKGFHCSSDLVVCSHQHFVDDTILMGISAIGEARVLKKALVIYEEASWQFINRGKSSIFFLNTPKERQQRIANILGCTIVDFPSIYLSLSLGTAPPESF